MEGKLYEEIYTYLISQFSPGEEIPADVVVKRILAGGYVPQRYGYQNMREMFADLRRFLTVKNTADGKMSVSIKELGSFDSYASKQTYEPKPAHTRRGSGEIGLLSGMSLEEDSPKRSKALPENYAERLPENKIFPVKKAAEEKQPARDVPRYVQPVEPQQLPLSVKQKIYAAVVMGLQLEKPLYMSTLSPVLRYAGVEHDKLGFLKSKNMLKCCADFMDFEEVVMNGVPQTLVTVHRVPEWDEKLPRPEPVSKEQGLLDDAEKKRIYELLCAHMTFGEPLHMAAFSPILRTYGFDYHNYGFMKVKELAAALQDFLSLQEVMMNGVPQTLVTLHPYEQKADASPTVQEENRRELHQIAFLPPKILSVLSRMTGNPVWACENALEESYQAAKKKDALLFEEKHISRKGVLSEQKEKTVRFPLTLQTMRGDSLVGELHETGTPEGKPWFLAWVGSPTFVKAVDSDEPDTSTPSHTRTLTPVLSDCCALSDSVVRAAAFKAVHASEQQTKSMIIAAYEAAYQNGTITQNGEEYSFLLGMQNAQGKEITVLIAPNKIGDKPFYVRFVGVVASMQTAPVDSGLTLSTAPRVDQAPLPAALTTLAYLPISVISLLAHRVGLLQEEVQTLLCDSYVTARENKTISRTPQEIRFPLLVKSLEGEVLYAILSPSMSKETDWFLQHFEAEQNAPEVTEPEALPPTAFEQFAFLGDWDAQLRFLAQTANLERWDFTDPNGHANLRAYLDGVFVRILSQDKLIYNADQDTCIFHTGLQSRFGYDILIQLAKNLPGSKLPWRFERFVIGRYDSQFIGTPVAATYFDQSFLPYFDTDRNMLLPEKELILDRLEILPLEMLRRCSGAFEISLIEQMKADKRKAAGCYARLRECYAQDPTQPDGMVQALQRAIGYALHRARGDYLFAAAGYLPKLDAPVWLLPLQLQRGNLPDVVLAYALDHGSYRPVGLLTVREAYLAARFVRRLEGFWLYRDLFETIKE